MVLIIYVTVTVIIKQDILRNVRVFINIVYNCDEF